MRTSQIGIKKIALREGTVLHVYKDSKGLPTAGVGHLIKPEEHAAFPLNKKITQEQSDKWLTEDLKECEDVVNSVGVKLAQNEFDALVSLSFNIGVAGFKRSSVVRRLKAGDKAGAAAAILLWDKPPEIQGRRRTEYNQFKTPYKDSAETRIVSHDKGVQNQSKPSDPTSDQLPPIETKTTEITSDDQKTVAVEQTQPAGDPPEAPPVQVSQNGPLAKMLFAGGGLLSLGQTVWGFVQGNLNSIAVGMICLTVLILAIIFRGAITDAIRMNTASDPGRKNVS